MIEQGDKLLGRGLDIWEEIFADGREDDAEGISSNLLLDSDGAIDFESLLCIYRRLLINVNIITILSRLAGAECFSIGAKGCL